MKDMSKLLEHVFLKRGYTDEFLNNLDNDVHSELFGTNDMISRLKQIHDNQDLIVFIPDFDMDGICSGVTGFGSLAELGFNAALFLPNPTDGYGFGENAVKRLIAEYPAVRAIMTGDVGISEHNGIDYAKRHGIQVLVTDHHADTSVRPMTKLSPDVIIDPMRECDSYEHPYICGAHVVHQVFMSYASAYCTVMEQEQIRRLVVFSGIGTVSDTMPMLYENRTVVRESINLLRAIYMDGDPFVIQAIRGCDIYRRIFKGLFDVMQLFAENGKLSKGNFSINEEFFGYYLAPMFNSVKRVGNDMSHAFNIFFGVDSVNECKYMYDLNNKRKELVVKYMNEITTIKQPYAEFGIYFTTAPGGICGLLAQKIMAFTGMPVFVIHETPEHHFAGSGRSPHWYMALDRCTAAGFYLAGHNPAFGCGFTDMREIKAFSMFVRTDVHTVMNELGQEYFDSQKAAYDFVIDDGGNGDTPIDILAFVEFMSDLRRYQPFGPAFEKPRVLLRFKPSDGEWSVMGSESQHMKVVLSYGFTVLLFGQADLIDLKESESEICVDGSLDMSIWNSSHTVNFIGDVIKVGDKNA